MDPGTVTLNRWFVGAAAAASFAAAGWIAAAAPDEEFWWGGFLRGGIVLVALWFCLPTKARPAAWADFNPLSAAIFLGTLFLAIIRPKVGLPALIVVLAARSLFRRMRPPGRTGGRNGPSRFR